MTRTFFRPISLGILLLLVLLAITPFAMKVAVDTGVSAHAFTKHGSDALAAQTCKNNPSAIRFYNPSTNRTGLVCQLEDSGWAVVILDKYGQEVTSFVKNKMKNLDQVLRYMVNAGYNLVH